ncbi:MAG TPA: prenyltransferase, partial [Armatimonadota bacterium]|nr:prenyltransferase [Armatimonadota bacterium]
MNDINPTNQSESTCAQYIKCIVGPMRVPFLLLPLVCVLLGVVAAMLTTATLNIWHVVLTFIGGVTAHISVNALNEYCDFRSELDTRTTRTPFSGGSGVLPQYPDKAWVGLATGVVTLGITAAIGVFFLYLHGMALLPLGLIGLIIIVVYTPRITHQPALCLIAPGLGFGPLMVVGTQVALTGHATLLGWLVSLVPFFLVNNLLLLNQFPDVEADRSVGRKHVLIILGRERSSTIYALFLAAAYLVIIVGVVLKYLPPFALLGLATILIAIPTMRGVMRYKADSPRLVPSLIMNVVINLATPVLLSA